MEKEIKKAYDKNKLYTIYALYKNKYYSDVNRIARSYIKNNNGICAKGYAALNVTGDKVQEILDALHLIYEKMRINVTLSRCTYVVDEKPTNNTDEAKKEAKKKRKSKNIARFKSRPKGAGKPRKYGRIKKRKISLLSHKKQQPDKTVQQTDKKPLNAKKTAKKAA